MIHDLKPYPGYKDSGVPWLGEVPEHWEVTRLKQVCRFAYGDSLPSEIRNQGDIFVFGSNGSVGFHSIANTHKPCIVIGRKGSFGKVNFSTEPVFAIDTTFFIDDRLTKANLHWLYYLLSWLRLDEVSKDSAVPGLHREDAYKRIVAYSTDSNEQSAIVHYLDHFDRRIRHYIRAKKKLIKLLEEQKQAITHQAVTRGLDPNVKFKPSGVEWLGEIPEQWEVKPAKWYYREVDERSSTGSEEMLSVSHITGVTPRSEKNITMFMAESYVGHKLCREGDLVINTMWAWMAALGIARQTGIISPSYAVYRPIQKNAFLPQFIDLLLRIKPYVDEYICRSTGIRSSRLRLYPEQFLSIPIIRPPIAEQQAILDKIYNATSELENAIHAYNQGISLLREYRTRLISDVVTGKLDVREAAANLPEEIVETESYDDALAEDEELENNEIEDEHVGELEDEVLA